MFVDVPGSGLPDGPPNSLRVRDATQDDVGELAALEMQVSGISRKNDYIYLIANEDALWHVSVVESTSGIDGYLASCSSAAFNMLGPGVTRTEEQAVALIYDQLNRHRGRTPVLLAPVTAGLLVKQLYDWGARNCEMHVAQSFGPAQQPTGVVMPTFLPESG